MLNVYMPYGGLLHAGFFPLARKATDRQGRGEGMERIQEVRLQGRHVQAGGGRHARQLIQQGRPKHLRQPCHADILVPRVEHRGGLEGVVVDPRGRAVDQGGSPRRGLVRLPFNFDRPLPHIRQAGWQDTRQVGFAPAEQALRPVHGTDPSRRGEVQVLRRKPECRRKRRWSPG